MNSTISDPLLLELPSPSIYKVLVQCICYIRNKDHLYIKVKISDG